MKTKQGILFLLALLLMFAAVACTLPSVPGEPVEPGTENGQKDHGASEPEEKEEKDSKYSKEELLKEMYDVPIVDFELEDLKGNMVKLSDYKGKIVFLNFWATWCPPCKEEMPYMQELYEEYKDQDVAILAVNPASVELRKDSLGEGDAEEAEKRVREFIEKEGFTFPILLDRKDEVWAVYMQWGIPANYIIDKEGIIRYLIPGAFISKDQMLEIIEKIRAIE